MNPRTRRDRGGRRNRVHGTCSRPARPSRSSPRRRALQAGLTTPSTELPVRVERRCSTASRCRTPAGRSAAARLTNAFANSCDTTFAPLGAQLGAPRAGGDAPAVRLRPADRDRQRARRARSRRPARSAVRWRSAPRRSVRAWSRRARWRWPTSPPRSPTTVAGRCRRCSPGRKPRFVRATTPQGRRRGPGDDGGGGRSTAPAPPRRSPASPSPARPAPPSSRTRPARRTTPRTPTPGSSPTRPSGDPKVVVCALFPNAGYGGDTAAPAVRQVLEARARHQLSRRPTPHARTDRPGQLPARGQGDPRASVLPGAKICERQRPVRVDHLVELEEDQAAAGRAVAGGAARQRLDRVRGSASRASTRTG